MTAIKNHFLMRSAASGVERDAKQRGFSRIQWLAVLLPTLSIALFEFLRHQLLAHLLPGWLGTGWLGNVAGTMVVAAIVFVFVRYFAATLSRLTAETARAREEAAVVLERQRIARDMHDGVAQTLFYLGVKLQEVEDLMASGADGRAREELTMVEEDVQGAHRQVRTVIADLKEQTELEDLGSAIRRTAAELEDRLDVRVSCEIDGEATVPDSSCQHLLAIIHEALTNARRHGYARKATISLKEEVDGMSIEISDDGTGFDPEKISDQGHYGLAIMSERAQMAGGELRLNSAPGYGTRVKVHLSGTML